MSHRDYHRPTNPGAVPEYERTATPVFLVNPDGSPQERRRDDTDNSGMEQRRPPGQTENGRDHWWACWGDEKGPGAQFRTEVRGELASIKSRITWYNGGVAVLSALGLAILGAWLSSRFQAAERAAVKREDVAAAVQKSAEMAVAKQSDDFLLLKQQIERAAADTSLPPAPMTTKAKR